MKFQWSHLQPMERSCVYCGEKFIEGDVITVFSDLQLMHQNCAVRTVIGSASHILKMCSCFRPGSPEGDPPELSLREAANLAVELWEEERKKKNA